MRLPHVIFLLLLAPVILAGGWFDWLADAQVRMDEWTEKNAPNGFKKLDRAENVVINRNFDGRLDDGRRTFFKFPGGDSIREDQPGLIVFNADLRNGKTQGGSGVTVHGLVRFRNWHFKGPSERLLKVADGAKVYLDNCLFNGAPVHTILVGSGGKVFSGRNAPNIYIGAQSAFRPMAVRHGVRGPDDNPKPIRKWRGSYIESSEKDVFLNIGAKWKRAHSNDRFKEAE